MNRLGEIFSQGWYSFKENWRYYLIALIDAIIWSSGIIMLSYITWKITGNTRLNLVQFYYHPAGMTQILNIFLALTLDIVVLFLVFHYRKTYNPYSFRIFAYLVVSLTVCLGLFSAIEKKLVLKLSGMTLITFRYLDSLRRYQTEIRNQNQA